MFVLGLLLAFLTFSHSAIVIPACEYGSERGFLTEIFNKTNGQLWTNSKNWGSNADVCQWYGVSCNQSSNVIKLDLSKNQIHGEIPDNFNCLPFLKHLDLSNNSLVGSFPTSFKYLSASLQYIYMGSTGLYGEIPSSVAELTFLKELNLSNNGFTNSVENLFENISKLITLEKLDLSCNKFTGSGSIFAKGIKLASVNLNGNGSIVCPAKNSLKIALFRCGEAVECKSAVTCPASLERDDHIYLSETAYIEKYGSIPEDLKLRSSSSRSVKKASAEKINNVSDSRKAALQKILKKSKDSAAMKVEDENEDRKTKFASSKGTKVDASKAVNASSRKFRSAGTTSSKVHKTAPVTKTMTANYEAKMKEAAKFYKK